MARRASTLIPPRLRRWVRWVTATYAYKVAQQAKALGIEIFTISYGVNENCTHDSTSSPWYNKPATQLLQRIATDASHFYNQPKTQDLHPVFRAIGVSLASGSKLVQ